MTFEDETSEEKGEGASSSDSVGRRGREAGYARSRTSTYPLSSPSIYSFKHSEEAK